MKYAVLIFALVVLAYLVMDFNGRMAELNRLRNEREIVSERLESRKATQAALDAQIAYATSDRAVMDWAYQNHLARPGDYAVIPLPMAQTTPETPAAQPEIQVTVTNLERWLSLFIDPVEP